MTEKNDDQRSVFRRVFPSKNALQTKRPVFYSPGEFTGRRSETHLHKRKVEILRFRAKRELSSNLPPKTKKPTRRPVGGEFSKWSSIFLFFRKILSTSNRRIFRVSKGGAFSLLEKFSGRNWNFILPQKEFEHRENGRKEIRTSDLYS